MDVLQKFPNCKIINENENFYVLQRPSEIPWVILTPKEESYPEFELMRNAYEIKEKLDKVFPGYIHNIAKLGNMNPNLHIHIAYRKEGDPAWPGAIWCKEKDLELKDTHLEILKKMLKE